MVYPFVVEYNTGPVLCYEVTGNLEIDYKMRDLCRQPYPGNPEGCPYYGKRDECPPQAPLIEDFIDLSKPHYFLVSKCIRTTLSEPSQEKLGEEFRSYWNGHMEDILREHVQEFQKDHPGTVFTFHPSAVGVDVLKTAKKTGIPLEITPGKIFYKIVLIGYPVARD